MRSIHSRLKGLEDQIVGDRSEREREERAAADVVRRLVVENPAPPKRTDAASRKLIREFRKQNHPSEEMGAFLYLAVMEAAQLDSEISAAGIEWDPNRIEAELTSRVHAQFAVLGVQGSRDRWFKIGLST